MALGTVTQIIEGTSYVVELMASVIAANGAPSGTNGISTELLGRLGRVPTWLRCAVKSTAGSGTMTVTVRIWIRLGDIGWIVAKPFNASSSAPQTAVAIAETSTDAIAYSEVVEIPGAADRVYMEVVAIAGTNTAVTGYALVAHPAG